MLSQESFKAVTDLFHRTSGIRLTEAKRPLVAGRLQKLAQARGLNDLDAYVQQLLDGNDPDEMVKLIDKLTTNETYFFREPDHFDVLAERVARRPKGSPPLRVWSAASSTGDEAYSIAMLLANHLGLEGWEIVGTDLSTDVLAKAARACYPMERAQGVAEHDLKRWCLKGQGAHEGQMLIAKELRRKVRFTQANLTQDLPDIGTFDVIFLRNVLIYFDVPGKVDVVNRVLTRLRPGGWLFTGHAESIANLGLPVRAVRTAVYEAAHAG